MLSYNYKFQISAFKSSKIGLILFTVSPIFVAF